MLDKDFIATGLVFGFVQMHHGPQHGENRTFLNVEPLAKHALQSQHHQWDLNCRDILEPLFLTWSPAAHPK